jgi:hypothetical protein
MSVPKPSEFFEQTIPDLFDRARERITDAQRAVAAAFGFRVVGDDGGAWTIRFANGDLRIEQGIGDDCLVVVEQPTDAWHTGWREAGGAGEDPIGALVAEPERIKPEWLDKVRQVHGTLRATLVDGDESIWEITVRFGRGPVEPQTTVIVPLAAADEIRTGRMQPQQAMMSGRLKIRGDMNLAMQAAALAMLR